MTADLIPLTRSCVAVGRFNPAIVDAAWIVKQQILPSGEAGIQHFLGSTVVEYQMSGLRWRPTTSRLEVEAEEESVDPGGFVAAVLEKLSHTPVQGVGNNFAFQIPVERAAQVSRRLRSPLVDVMVDRDVVASPVSAAMTHEKDCLASVTIEFGEEGAAQIQFNFHRTVGSAAGGIAAAKRWKTDQQAALELALRIVEAKPA